MNPKQELFCREYLIDLNATQAAIRAGYSEQSARNQGTRMMKNDEVLSRVKQLQEERMQQLGLDAYWVLKRLKDISDRAIQATPVLEWDHLRHEYRETGEYQFDGASAIRAAELIGKHIGMFTEKLKVDMNAQVVIIDDVPDED